MWQYSFFSEKSFWPVLGQKRDFWPIFGLKRPKIRVLSYFLEIGWSKCSDFLHYDRKSWYLENVVKIFFIAYLIWPIMADFWPENAKNGPKTGFHGIFSRLACGNILIFCIMIGNYDILKMVLKFFHRIFNLARNC